MRCICTTCVDKGEPARAGLPRLIGREISLISAWKSVMAHLHRFVWCIRTDLGERRCTKLQH
ncbi:hypothetical protein LT42_25025 [Pseudomonas lutea]|uniref:Uncharacterized protein n=1 Tax=Pseudomonas lutea TaxID=243924 RepID=A0A9X0EAX5_9PSED|nr:hypothetical protein LT42_25025 [Pseudomonas lutea]